MEFKQQDFQTAAVNAVCSLFKGQRITTATFGMEQIEFSNTEVLPLGKAIEDVDEKVIKRAQNFLNNPQMFIEPGSEYHPKCAPFFGG